MAVVNENSAQANARMGGRKQHAYKDQARVLELVFNLTEVVAGDPTSVQRLQFIPPGTFRLHRESSFLVTSAFGASRTLAIGWEAYRDKDGTVVAASTAGLNAATDVSAIATMKIGVALAVGYKDFESRDGVWITSVVAGGTIPAGATVDGLLHLTES
jgi:hypothetical protein